MITEVTSQIDLLLMQLSRQQIERWHATRLQLVRIELRMRYDTTRHQQRTVLSVGELLGGQVGVGLKVLWLLACCCCGLLLSGCWMHHLGLGHRLVVVGVELLIGSSRVGGIGRLRLSSVRLRTRHQMRRIVGWIGGGGVGGLVVSLGRVVLGHGGGHGRRRGVGSNRRVVGGLRLLLGLL